MYAPANEIAESTFSIDFGIPLAINTPMNVKKPRMLPS